ncbi:hypothetical protein ACLB1Q_05920 [Escherichia coli]
MLNFASLGIIAHGVHTVACQMRLRKAIKEGKAADVSFNGLVRPSLPGQHHRFY